MKYKKLVLIGGIIIVLAISVFGYFNRQEALGLATTAFRKYTGDVIGTKTGTSTTYVYLDDNATGRSATSSYRSLIGDASTAIYAFKVGAASSTADAQFSIFASNDDYCNASSTDTAMDTPLIQDINWFDAAPFLFNNNTAQAFTNGTSSLLWNTSDKPLAGRTLLLTNLAAVCLRLDVSVASTSLRTELRLK